MKRAWIAGLVVALALPAAAVAQEPVAAWCGGSYGALGTNFAPCEGVEREVQIAGQGGGLTRQTVTVPTTPEYPATAVTFEEGRAFFHTTDGSGQPMKQEMYLNWAAGPDRSEEFQAGD
jgi:hypothetical protein